MKDMTNRELIDKHPPKGCPFCGYRRLESGQEPKMNYWYIQCKSCRARGPERRSKERALYLWNFRKMYKDVT